MRKRILLARKAQRPLFGVVEVAESFFGSRRDKDRRGHGAYGKTVVFGIFERQGQVYTEIVPDCSRPTPRGIIRVAEALDRVSRDRADVATLYKHLRFAGVMIVTLSEGEINELHVGRKGTMNALFLKDLAAKTHRGLRGWVEQGRSGGGLCYGYDVVNNSCSDGRGIRRSVIEERVLAGLKNRLMAPEAAAEAMRAYAEETNRINREPPRLGCERPEGAGRRREEDRLHDRRHQGRRLRPGHSGPAARAGSTPGRARRRLSAAPADLPDIHPNLASIYRRKVARFAEALRKPEERDVAAAAIRELIERIVLTPGAKWAEMDATLHGDLGTILGRAGNGVEKGKTDTRSSGMSVSVVAGARNPRDRHLIEIPVCTVLTYCSYIINRIPDPSEIRKLQSHAPVRSATWPATQH